MNFKNTTVELRVGFYLQALRKAWCKMQKSKQKKVRRKTLIFSTCLGASSLLWRLHMLILRTDSKQIQNCRASPCLFQGNNIFKIFEGAGGFQSLSIQRATAKLPWAHECGLSFLRTPSPDVHSWLQGLGSHLPYRCQALFIKPDRHRNHQRRHWALFKE